MRRRKYILIRCTERRRPVEAFVKKVWKCPLSCEPNGSSLTADIFRLQPS